MGWHRLRPYRFQVYLFKSPIIFCHHIFGPLYPLTGPHPLPSDNHYTVVCVYEFQSYIPHMSEIIWFLAFSDWLTSLSIIFSRSLHVVTNGIVFIGDFKNVGFNLWHWIGRREKQRFLFYWNTSHSRLNEWLLSSSLGWQEIPSGLRQGVRRGPTGRASVPLRLHLSHLLLSISHLFLSTHFSHKAFSAVCWVSEQVSFYEKKFENY